MSAPLELVVSRFDDATVVTLRGDAGITEAPILAQGLLPVIASKPSHVILDLAGLMFICSLAIGEFVILRRSLAPGGGKVTIAGAHDRVLKALQHAQLEYLFEFVDEAPRFAST